MTARAGCKNGCRIVQSPRSRVRRRCTSRPARLLRRSAIEMTTPIVPTTLTRKEVFVEADRLRRDLTLGKAMPYGENTKAANDVFLEELSTYKGATVQDLRNEAAFREADATGKSRLWAGLAVGSGVGPIALGIATAALLPFGGPIAAAAVVGGVVLGVGGLVVGGDRWSDAAERVDKASSFRDRLNEWAATLEGEPDAPTKPGES